MGDMDAEAVVIGGGVIGCAVAWELSRFLSPVFLLERLPRLGEGNSTRNSGVIHSGIYYPTGSLKARACLEGNERLHVFCAENGVAHEKCGKMIAAVETEEIPGLERLARQGEANGVPGIRMLSAREAREKEPEAAVVAALWLPSTGILDPAELVAALARKARAAGAEFLVSAEVTRIAKEGEAIRIGSTRGSLLSRFVVNAAGIFSDRVARLAGNDAYRLYPCRGEYCEVIPDRRHLVRGLLYPAPHVGPGLGVHFTRTVAGGIMVGPNARYIDGPEDYEGDPTPVDAFWEAGRKLVPALRKEDLRPGYSGIRAKLAPPDDPTFRDFVCAADPRLPNLVHLVGIESPGLTASLALARQAAGIVRLRQ